MRQTVRELLADYAALLNKHGADSDEAKAFLESHQDNQRFIELARLSKVLKKALNAPVNDGLPRPDHIA